MNTFVPNTPEPNLSTLPTAKLLRVILIYLGWLSLCILAPNLAYRHYHRSLRYQNKSLLRYFSDAESKVLYLKRNGSPFNLIFVGDSRTYCGIDPHVIDSILGTHSLNMGHWTFWFPTQYPSYQDILDDLSPGTTVVWSVGHQNFKAAGERIGLNYPIGFRNSLTYFEWGYPISSYIENLFTLLPGLDIYADREMLFSKMRTTLNLPIHVGFTEANAATAIEKTDIQITNLNFESKLAIAREPITADGRLTSYAYQMDRGNYVRVEVNPDFFRSKQRASMATLKPIVEKQYEPDPPYWKTFLGVLELFKKKNVRLIVNEIQEAPYHYTPKGAKIFYYNFMERVRIEVERNNIPFIRVNFDSLSDADYFDYNHLNSVGLVKYSKMVANALQPHLVQTQKLAKK